MKLPIIQSIVFGSLKPKICLLRQEINGNMVDVPYQASELWNISEKMNVFPVFFDGVDEYGSPVLHPLERPEEDLDFQNLANMFSKLPSTLSELESLCIRGLSGYVPFEYERYRPVNLSKAAPFTYTSISENYFHVDYRLFNYSPQHPFAKFYLNIIHAEMERIKLYLLNFAEITQSDIATKSEVEDILSLLQYYSTEVTGKQVECTVFSVGRFREISSSELEQRTRDFNIFPLLQQYLVKTYIEIEILFQPILKRNIEQDFDDVVYKCIKQYPPALLKLRLQAAILIQKAQQYIASNEINALSFYYPEFVRLYPSNSDNPTFLAVFKAVENAIFLGDNTDILQLVDEKFCKTQFRERKKALEEEINALTNPREIQSVIEDELDQLDLFVDNNIPFQSIPRRLCSWLTAQLETTKQNLGNIFLPASKNTIEKSPSKQKVSKSSVRDQIKVVKSHLDFLTGYINNEKIMKDDDYENLIQYITTFLTEKKVPAISARIRTNTTQVFLRYTFYLMYKDLKLKQPSRNAWVSLLHAIFPQFNDTDESVTYKKFSTKPDLYDSDKKSILASQP